MAVARISAVLAAFDARHRELRVTEISRRAGLPKSTTSRLVADLVVYGLLERSGARLRMGIRLFELGELASRQPDLRAIALPHMADLREATWQTVHLAVLEGTEISYVEIMRSGDAPPMPSQVGGRLPAHACAAGKALLARSDEPAVDLVCGRPLRAVGPRTVVAPGLLRRQLGRVRETGLAYDSEESGPGVGSVASAILHADGRPAAAISVSGWTGKLNPRLMGPAVRTVALAIGRELCPSTSAHYRHCEPSPLSLTGRFRPVGQ
jgi:DNA-binding IclR family transcriptional regulator